MAEDLEEETGNRCVPHACHVGHWDELPGLVDAAYDAFGRLDILVNNAGMSPLYPALDEVSEDLFDKTVNVNLKGPFRLCALAGARMKSSGGGLIINVSSIASVRPTPRELPYAAAKAGLNVLTTGFALSLGPEVRVNTIMAGPFLTDIARAWDMQSFENHAQSFPLRRAGQPDEIVGAALYPRVARGQLHDRGGHHGRRRKLDRPHLSAASQREGERTMKIHIDQDLCSGHGRCYTLSPNLVQADDEGFPVQQGQDIEISPSDEAAGRKIVANCPEGAIRVVEG